MASGRSMFSHPMIILFMLFNKYFCNAQVPVLIWTNNGSLENEKVVLGHTLSNNDVVSRYLDPVFQKTSENLVIFLQDKLSIDDLTKYATTEVTGKKSVFGNLEKILGHQNSVSLPSVVQKEGERALVQLLKEKFHGHVEEIYSTDVDDWKASPQLSKSKNNFLIFHLKPLKSSTEDGKAAILSSNDDVVGKITEHLNTLGTYTALMTSNEPSEIVENLQNQMLFDAESNHPDFQRHLLATRGSSSPKYFYNFSDCFYMYATTVTFQLKDESVSSFSNVSHVISNSTSRCRTNDSSITISYKTSGNVTKFDLSMQFETGIGSTWQCSKMQVAYSNKSSKEVKTYNFSCNAIAVPRTLYSYSCGKSAFEYISKNTSDKNSVPETLATLTFGHFQIQPFGISGGKFSEAFDCTPFFTVPILTGLFVGFILIAVMFWGIFSIIGIQTMDRFDDPKGQTIQVPLNE